MNLIHVYTDVHQLERGFAIIRIRDHFQAWVMMMDKFDEMFGAIGVAECCDQQLGMSCTGSLE